MTYNLFKETMGAKIGLVQRARLTSKEFIGCLKIFRMALQFLIGFSYRLIYYGTSNDIKNVRGTKVYFI